MHHIKYFRSLFSLSRKPAKNRFQPNSALFTNSAESFSLAARFYFYYLGNEADLIPRLLLFASPGCGSFTRCTFRKPVQPILCVLPLRLNGGSGLTGARTVLQRRKFHRRSGKATEQPALRPRSFKSASSTPNHDRILGGQLCSASPKSPFAVTPQVSATSAKGENVPKSQSPTSRRNQTSRTRRDQHDRCVRVAM